MRGMKSKPVQIVLKLGSILFVCAVLVVYINWDSLKRQSTERIKFKVFSGDGYLQIVPSIYNTSKRFFYSEYRNLSEQFDLRIIAIVYNRAGSLLRLLDSLNNAEYEGDKIRLEVWIDRSVNGSVDKKTYDAAKSYTFKYGSYQVIPHKQHVGIFGQWLSTWKPDNTSSEIAVILEDDLTVSPYFYKYLKLVHSKYDRYPQVNGFALQGISIKHSGNGYLEGPKDSQVFLYPVVGTWGFSPSKKNWMNFLEWFSKMYPNKEFHPLVPGNVVTAWYQVFLDQGRTNNMWSIWHIYYAWKQKEFSLYPSFKGHHGLSANWKEQGLHYAGRGSGSVSTAASNPVLTEWRTEYEQHMPEHPAVLDIAGHVTEQWH